VIHFAASKAVGESVENPLLYYENNISALIYFCRNYNKSRSNFILVPVRFMVKPKRCRDASIQIAMSPYGNTKQREEIITDTAKVTNINAILLRYFNQGHIHQLKLNCHWEFRKT
jgi:UDP-glucose 4-epimerase